MRDKLHLPKSSALCEPPGFFVLAYLVPLVLQCSLLHPSFSKSSSLRLLRRALTPINFYLCIRFPFFYCFLPLEQRLLSNIRLSALGFYFAVKSLDWGFSKGPYYTRTLKVIDGIKQWERDELSESVRQAQEENEVNILELFRWTLSQLTSMRGFSFSWGPTSHANTYSTLDLFYRFYKVKLAGFCALYVILSVRDSPFLSLRSALLSLGLPDFPGLNIFAEAFLTLAFGILLATNIDAKFTSLTLYVTAIHELLIFCNLPKGICEFFNPTYYPPLFNSPHKSNSLEEFWSRGWHTVLRRTFLIGGGKPAGWLTKAAGGGVRMQKIACIIGAFVTSALFHEYMLLVVFQVPHSNPHIFPTSFPGSGIYFLLQPFGIIIEPYIIPLIPKKLGGGKMWVWIFGLVTAYTFRAEFSGPHRLLSAYPPFSKIPWKFYLIP